MVDVDHDTLQSVLRSFNRVPEFQWISKVSTLFYQLSSWGRFHVLLNINASPQSLFLLFSNQVNDRVADTCELNVHAQWSFGSDVLSDCFVLHYVFSFPRTTSLCIEVKSYLKVFQSFVCASIVDWVFFCGNLIWFLCVLSEFYVLSERRLSFGCLQTRVEKFVE